MTSFKSLLRIVGFGLGSMGIVICFAAITLLWMVSGRLDRATASLFSKIDDSLVLVRQRLGQSRERVAAATITARDVETALRVWTIEQTARGSESRIQAAEKTERLASALHQVDNWLEISRSSIAVMNEALSIVELTSTSAQTTLLDRSLQEISSLQTLCAEATELADKVHERLANVSGENLSEEGIAQAVPLVMRAVAMFSSFDSRLEKSAERLSLAQRQLQELKSQMQRWIFGVTIGITLLLCWMAAGQTALCRLAWNCQPLEPSRIESTL